MKGKHFAKAYWSRTRVVSAILSVALLFGCITFTTAWLIAENKEGPVVNEFTGSKLKIELTPENDQGPYRLIPGMTYELDDSQAPKITVEKDSVECYLFVVFHEVGTKVSGVSKHLDEFVSYNYNSAENWGMFKLWKTGTDANGMPYKDYIFYVKTPADDTELCNYVHTNPTQNQTFNIMAKNASGKAYFTVSDQLTKQLVAPANLESNPYITFTAYSIQTLGFKGQTKTGTDEEKVVADMNLAWAAVEAAINNNNTEAVVLH